MSNTKQSLLDKIVQELESDIIFGRLKPYQELIEDALMERFDAKRHVVRAAIQTLVNRNIVVKPPSKSARVKNFTLQEVKELYQLRALLQRYAVEVMPLPVNSEDLNRLKEIHIQYETAVKIGADPLTIHLLNDQFHKCLFSFCQNHMLCEAINTYTEISNPIRSYGIVDKEWLKQAIDEHAQMIQAIEDQDREKLSILTVQHMQPTRLRWENMNNLS